MRPKVILHQPQIAGNFGAVLRTAACFGAGVGAVEPFGFPLDAKALRRAAMDYGAGVDLERFPSWNAYREAHPEARRVLLTTRGAEPLSGFAFAPGDHLVFGNEGSGAPDPVHADAHARVLIPIAGRSLNLSNAVAITLFESLRQLGRLPS